MKRIVVRTLALLLSVILCVGLLPVYALADEEPEAEAAQEEVEVLAEEPAEEEEVEAEEPEEEPAEEPEEPAEEAEEEVEELPQSADADSSLGEGAEELPEEEAIAETYGASSGSCGANLTWTLSDNGVLTISGTGAMANFEWASSPWYADRMSIYSIVVESGVTTVSDYAFTNCRSTSDVTLPSTLKSIGAMGFAYCTSLTSIELPIGLERIGSNAFDECKALISIAIPNSVTDIAWYAFDACSALKSVTLPSGLTSIEEGLFYQCKSLTSISIPNNVSNIGEWAFFECENLKSIVIPASVTKIGSRAFADCRGLTEITFQGSAPTFGAAVFRNVTAKAYYPSGDASWTSDVMQQYDGQITWVAKEMAPALTVSGMAKGGVSLSWTDVGASKYQLQRSEDTGGYKSLATVTELTYTDGKVTMGVRYKYQVRAYVDGAWGDWSDEVDLRFNPFSDVDTNGANFSHIAWAYNKGIITGTSDTTFSPNSSLTRAQFVMMLWKMNGSPKVTGVKNPFQDVTGSKTTKAVLWALKKGIIVSGKSFNPNGNISRIQVIMILWKLAGSPTVKGVKNPYTDVTGSKTIKAMNWAYKKGVRGTGETTFQPNVNCSRADMVTFMYMTR